VGHAQETRSALFDRCRDARQMLFDVVSDLRAVVA